MEMLLPYPHILRPLQGEVFRLEKMRSVAGKPDAEIVHEGRTYRFEKMISWFGQEAPFYVQTHALKVYTFGYFNQPAYALCDWVRDHDALLCDIRYCPRSSRFPEFSKEWLEKALGDNYYWIGDWGNTAYATPGVIELANWERGLQRLNEVEQAGWRTAVLMCACGNPQKCHRNVVGERLRGLGYTVEELSL